MARPMLIVSNKHRLAAVVMQKCASTSIITLFAELHGIPPATRERRALDTVYCSASPEQDCDAEIVVAGHEKIAESRDRLPDYAWFSVVRNPYDRLLSNYYNKINRFCARYRYDVYLQFKVRQILKGPKAWRDGRLAMPYLRERVSYRSFVDTLSRGGIDWDPHYRRQTELLRLDKVAYTRLLRLESLGDELPAFLREHGLPRTLASSPLRALNRSGADAVRGRPEELAVRHKVYDLYRADFERLHYPRCEDGAAVGQETGKTLN